MKSYSDIRDQHTLDMNGMDMGTGQRVGCIYADTGQEQNTTRFRQGHGPGLVRVTQSSQKYIEVHSAAHVDAKCNQLDRKLTLFANCKSL